MSCRSPKLELVTTDQSKSFVRLSSGLAAGAAAQGGYERATEANDAHIQAAGIPAGRLIGFDEGVGVGKTYEELQVVDETPILLSSSPKRNPASSTIVKTSSSITEATSWPRCSSGRTSAKAKKSSLLSTWRTPSWCGKRTTTLPGTTKERKECSSPVPLTTLVRML